MASFAGFVLSNEGVITYGIAPLIPFLFLFGVLAVRYLPPPR